MSGHTGTTPVARAQEDSPHVRDTRGQPLCPGTKTSGHRDSILVPGAHGDSPCVLHSGEPRAHGGAAVPQQEGLCSPSSALSRSFPAELSLPGLGLKAELGIVAVSKEPVF